MIENRDQKLWEIYNKLDRDDIHSGYEWPSFIEVDKIMSGGDLLAALQVALRCVVYCERNYEQSSNEAVTKIEQKFIIPFSVIYALYVHHFKKYLPDEPVPSIKEVSQAYVMETKGCDIHEEVKTEQ